MGRGQQRPSFDAGLSTRLRAALEEELADAAGALIDPLVVHKSALSQVHTCEGYHVARSAEPFEWSVPVVVGSVAHKAIELSCSLTSPPGPAELVDLAMGRLAEDADRGPGPWLSVAGAVEAAEVRGAATDRMVKYSDTFPPLRRSWRPRVESPVSASLCAGRIVLKGKVDLALGAAHGTRAGVLVVDFKAGSPSWAAADDLRFYALLETLRVGVPPFRVATWYLDSGHWQAEDVDEVVLDAAVRRVVGGARKLVELSAGRLPALTWGPQCGWCPVRNDCSGARQWAEDRASRGVLS